jgi:DNA polymerase-3 subunit epsilon
VAHNKASTECLAKSMALYGLNYEDLNLSPRGVHQVYKAKVKANKLSDCCRTMNIQLNHHEALSVSACAKLYLLRVVFKIQSGTSCSFFSLLIS